MNEKKNVNSNGILAIFTLFIAILLSFKCDVCFNINTSPRNVFFSFLSEFKLKKQNL